MPVDAAQISDSLISIKVHKKGRCYLRQIILSLTGLEVIGVEIFFVFFQFIANPFYQLITKCLPQSRR